MVWLAKDIEHTMELQTSKLGSERRGRSIGSAGSRIDTDKSSGLPKPSKQDEGTQATSSLQQDLLKGKCVAINSAIDCLRKRLGGVRLHPHGGLISRRGAEILPQIFLWSPASLCARPSRATPPCPTMNAVRGPSVGAPFVCALFAAGSICPGHGWYAWRWGGGAER